LGRSKKKGYITIERSLIQVRVNSLLSKVAQVTLRSPGRQEITPFSAKELFALFSH
jgi:hypothetical protein